ncbi:MAG: CRISPR-associated endonuclease Cas1 [Lachnospiraceae bacterium]|nr:CRISPR-associated endonuclease Cas1 [Lachnospiraceae bacterium]
MVLVVQGYGTSIGKRSNCLVVKNAEGEKEISADKIEEVHIYPSCGISSDAIQLCINKEIWIVFLNKYGEPEGDVEAFSGGSSPIYKRNQLMLMHNREGVELVKEFLSQKIENRVRQLKAIRRNRRKMQTIQMLSESIKRMEDELRKIQAVSAADMDVVRGSLQGYEGNAGKAYFDAISNLLADDMKFDGRRRNASDIYNSVLNYLYGILYSKIKRMTYKCRLDPYIGIMHTDSYNKPTFVFDYIEGQRIICEELAFEICSDRKITWEDVCETDGRLCFSESARKLLISEFYEKMNEKCYYRKKQVTVERRIYLEILDVAQRIGGMDTDVLAAV